MLVVSRGPLRMALLIDTAMVPARERLDFWLESSSDAYLPVQIRSAAREQFCARMWGYDARAAQLLPDRGGAEHDDAHVAGDRSLRPGVPARLGRSCADSSTRRRRARTGSAGIGDLISYETSHPVTFQADAAFESLIVASPAPAARPGSRADQQAHGAQDPRRRRAAARRRGVLPGRRRRPGGRDRHGE